MKCQWQNKFVPFPNYLSFRSCDSCCRLPEPKHHSFLFNHWSASKCLVFVAACTPSIHVFLGRPLFLLFPGIHSIINFGSLLSCILLTWPYHWSLFLSMKIKDKKNKKWTYKGNNGSEREAFSKLMLEIAEFKMLLFCITLKMSYSIRTDILYISVSAYKNL